MKNNYVLKEIENFYLKCKNKFMNKINYYNVKLNVVNN